MSFIDSFLPEFEHEAQGARTIIELVPDSLLSWRAADSLNTIGWVASHLADTLSWVEVTLTETQFDVAPVGGEPHVSPVFDSTAEILAAFDQHKAAAVEFFTKATNEQMAQPWTLLQGGEELFTMPRGNVAKMLFINHVVHHRAFLVAYLRMNGIECPGLYG